MKLTELEKKVLFDALTLYKKQNVWNKVHVSEFNEIDNTIAALRSKLKRALAEGLTNGTGPK